MFKKFTSLLAAVSLAALTAAGCGTAKPESGAAADTIAPTTTTAAVIETNLSKPDNAKWQYNADDDVYYQIGLEYCEKPVDDIHEKLAVFVPAAYMDAKDNGDGTFTCKLSESAVKNGYTAAKAPIVMPIMTEGYYDAKALTSSDELYEDLTQYTSQGFVYVHAGCRGINEGAPTGVADLKAAIRYLRYCDDMLAGDSESIFAYGMSGGGAQAAILGASGDSELYDPYLKAIGAVQGVSDAVSGSMDWCPITDLDTANAEYEWMMGCTRPERSEEEQALSDGLAKAFAAYVNGAGFIDKNGKALTLEESAEGIYQAGSYYDYVKSEIERSLNNYLSDTDFAATPLKSAKNYIDDLNSDGEWVIYNESANTAAIKSIAEFAKHCKKATNLITAFDQPQSQNTLFGIGDGKGSHFDKILAGVLAEQNSAYAADYEADFKKTDSVGNAVEQRLNMYTPLYYLMKTRDGYGKSTVAKYWRIRTGIEQSNTSVTTEINLALALSHYDGVKVDFETVWAQTHEPVERKGFFTENFVEWVNACASAK